MAVKKTAPKRKVAGKRTTKPATKKTARKKAASSKAAKKSAAKKKAPTKKVKVVKPRKKATITNTFAKQEPQPFSFPTKVNLAIVPAINLWPINPDTLVVSLARCAGTTFVMVGGFLSLWFAQTLGFFPIENSFTPLFSDSEPEYLLATDPTLAANQASLYQASLSASEFKPNSANLQNTKVSNQATLSEETLIAAEQKVYLLQLLVAAIAVTAIGLVLLLTAFQLQARPRSATKTTTAAAH